MANILVNMEHGIEVAATDVLKFLTSSQSLATKLERGVIAALGVLLGATDTALTGVSAATAQPLNIALDIATIGDIKAVWPAVMRFAQALGIKL
jgi:hypothetical protein